MNREQIEKIGLLGCLVIAIVYLKGELAAARSAHEAEVTEMRASHKEELKELRDEMDARVVFWQQTYGVAVNSPR